VATRQNSTSGRPKSPRIQVVLPEDVCERLGAVAEAEARTVSNMARVLIQQGLEVYEQQQAALRAAAAPSPAARTQDTDNFRQALEQQEQAEPKRLRGAPRRLRLNRPRA
jgi:predicted transcriptional regulator